MSVKFRALFLISLFALEATLAAIMNPHVQVVSQDVSELGEGPYFDRASGILYHVDATTGQFVALNPETGVADRTPRGSLISIIIPYDGPEPNTFIVSRWNELLLLHWPGKGQEATFGRNITIVNPGNGRERFNDGKADPRGRLFIGTVQESDAGVVPAGGSLYRLDGDKLTKVATGFTISNGMAWSNDAKHTKLYFNDSEGRKIYVFDYNIETGNMLPNRILIDLDNHPDFVAGEYPDGILIDKYGYIWVALWAGGRVVQIDPATARVVTSVPIPRAKIPSSLAPGTYKGVEGFFVTTASIGIPEAERQDDGKIHHISFQGGEVYKVASV